MKEIENRKEAPRRFCLRRAIAAPQVALIAGVKLQLRDGDIVKKYPGAARLVAFRAARCTRQRYDSGRAAGAGPADRFLVSVREAPVQTKARPQGKRLSRPADSPPQAFSAKSRKPSPDGLALSVAQL